MDVHYYHHICLHAVITHTMIKSLQFPSDLIRHLKQVRLPLHIFCQYLRDKTLQRLKIWLDKSIKTLIFKVYKAISYKIFGKNRECKNVLYKYSFEG